MSGFKLFDKNKQDKRPGREYGIHEKEKEKGKKEKEVTTEFEPVTCSDRLLKRKIRRFKSSMERKTYLEHLEKEARARGL